MRRTRRHIADRRRIRATLSRVGISPGFGNRSRES